MEREQTTWEENIRHGKRTEGIGREQKEWGENRRHGKRIEEKG